MAFGPLELTLHLVSGERTRDADRFLFQPRDYLRLEEEGTSKRASFPWNHALDDLANLGSSRPSPNTAQRLGELLRAFLMPLGWAQDEQRLRQALSDGGTVRLTLRLEPAELCVLPWELLALESTGQALSDLEGCTVCYERPGSKTHPPRPSPPPAGGRILFAWAGDVPAAAHQRALTEACARAGYAFDPKRDVLPHVSLASLEQALRSSEEPIASLHLLCHGVPSEPGAYGLAWNSSRREGELDVVDAASLRAALEPHAGRLRMVVLCACRGGDSGLPGNHLGSPARELHRAGLSAVVASRLPFSKVGSVIFTRALYGELLGRHASLEQSLAVARGALRLEGARMDGCSLQLYARAGDGPDLRPFIFQPYCGLRPFEPGDERRFFGREPLRQTLRQRLEAAAAGQLPALQVMAGVSGSGKSSLLRAGLLPTLPPERWEITRLRAGDAGTLETVRAVKASPGKHRLVVVDPLDEAFTLLEEEARAELMRALWDASQARERGTVVLATLRMDYLARCAEVRLGADGPRLDAVLFEGERLLLVPEMTAVELREAIERPSWQQGILLEVGLTERLLQDVERQPGGLPLLAHTLERLWRLRDGRWLKHGAYQALDGVAGALAQELDRLYLGLGEEERHQVRQLFVELVDMRDGAAPFTSQRVGRARIQPRDVEARRAFDVALGRLLEGRVLVLGKGDGGEVFIEVAHEALLRHWSPLGEWIREAQALQRKRNELRTGAEAWRSHPRTAPSGERLLRGRHLEDALELRQTHPGELDEQMRLFIDASQEMASTLAREARRQQEQLQDFARLIVADKLRREDPTAALLVLLEVREPEQHLSWTQTALEVFQQPIASAVLRGHRGQVRAATLSADGRWVATASSDGTARVWRADGTGLPKVLEGQGGEVLAVAFSPDGQRVVMGSADRTAHVWPVEGGGGPEVLTGHLAEVVMVAFSPDGQRVVTASRDGTARVRRADGTGLPIVLQGHSQGLVAATFDSTGERVVTASRDGTARVWHTDGRGVLAVLAHPGELRAAVFSPNGTQVATASVDGTVRIWRVEGRDDPILLRSDSGFVNAVAFSPDGGLVVSAHADGMVRLWRADGKGGAMRLAGHGGEILSVAFSPDGRWVLTASRDGTARVRSTEGGGLSAELRGHTDEVFSASFSSDGEQVVTASRDGTARVWRWRTQPRALTLQRRAGTVQSLAFSPWEDLLATGHADGTARLWCLRSGMDLVEFKGHRAEVRTVAFSPDGQRVVTASDDGTARVWSADGPGEHVVLQGHTGRVVAAAFSPEGERVVTASWDATARVWRADGQGEPVVLQGHTQFLRTAVFSPDGQRVVTASDDGTARVWRADGQGEPVVLQGHSGRVVAAVFSPDGERVATASWDGTARVWRADGRGEPMVLRGHEQALVSVEFSQDGAHVLTASQDRTVRVWSAEGRGEAVMVRGHTARFHPRGTWVVNAAGDGTVQVWPTDGSGESLVLSGNGDRVTGAVFSPGGDMLAIAATDGSARVWKLGGNSLREQLRQLTSASLEVRQRQRYLGERLDEAREAHAREEQTWGRQQLKS
ncbi:MULTISPECIES: nSTAND1 domain-containing NTPase [unclassified Corallococcus]|uniref:nSTAND1 domain-containing NTPase n=1 Tax=unclassified Corallococcus TaxID=2685029 RepID=UPI001A903441|nr:MULTISPECIES: CHAT domain-containing protein [unclassified Corallococcus]MBN9684341.1 CHAT domain-containing protein [Corallococcus sp. NCSPR001]WAS84180.1 CHAT domain-containing protein [Corallococcus sp. NCRR]